MKSSQKHEKAGSGKCKNPRSVFSTFFMTRFTASKIDENIFIKELDKRSIKAECNYEKGTKNGIEHYQFCYKTKSSKSYIKEREFWNDLFKELMFPEIDYLSIAKQTERCFTYCKKEDKTFVRHVYSKGIDKKEWKGYIDPFIKYEYFPWQRDIVDIISNNICPRTIYNFYGDYNIGKTDFCKHLSSKFGSYLLEGPLHHVEDEVSKVYKGVDEDSNSYLWSFVGDEYPPTDFFITLEKIKDMYFTSHHGVSKNERMVVGNRPHIFVFSNRKISLNNCHMDMNRFVFKDIGPSSGSL